MAFIDTVIQRGFVPAAAHAAVLELKLRLLAGASPALQPVALEHKLEAVEDAVLDYFKSQLRAGEAELLVATRQMRNKLLHGAFDDLRARVATRATVADGGVKLVSLGESPTAEGVLAALAAVEEHQKVHELPTDGGTLYGWVLECHEGGVFAAAVDQFMKASAVIDRLVELNSRPATPVDERR
ncbi:MAG TPA: hypothetical protein VMB50_02510 [Myxococcales bacterium]|nr:hypothetical protein [Myxococcales bacterium]